LKEAYIFFISKCLELQILEKVQNDINKQPKDYNKVKMQFTYIKIHCQHLLLEIRFLMSTVLYLKSEIQYILKILVNLSSNLKPQFKPVKIKYAVMLHP